MFDWYLYDIIVESQIKSLNRNKHVVQLGLSANQLSLRKNQKPDNAVVVSSSTFRVQSKALWNIRVPLGIVKFRLHYVSSREEQFNAFLCVTLSIFQDLCGFESFLFSLEIDLATTQASILVIWLFVT